MKLREHHSSPRKDQTGSPRLQRTLMESVGSLVKQEDKDLSSPTLFPFSLLLLLPSFPLPRKSRHRKRKTNKTGTALPSLSSWNHLASPDSFPHFFGPVGQGWGWGGQVGRGTRETEGRAEETRFGKAAKNREPRCLLWKTNFPGCLAC